MHMDFVYGRKGNKDSNVVCIDYCNVLHTFKVKCIHFSITINTYTLYYNYK